MIVITPELAERLKNNLIFDEHSTQTPVGAFNILFANETMESVGELYLALQALAGGAPVGLELPTPLQRPEILARESSATE